MLEIEDEELLRRFERGSVSHQEWNHQAHVRAAYFLLTQVSCDEALARMRAGLMQLNAIHKVPDEPGRGYHETLTQFWLKLIHHTLRAQGPAANSMEFCKANPHLLNRSIVRIFYSDARIALPEAKRHFLLPDLLHLP